MATLKLKSNIMELMCRTCLKMNKMQYNIFEHTQNNKLISDMIMECASIKVEKDDGFPVKICNSCVDKLNSACDFKGMVIQSNAKLQDFYLNKILEMEKDTQQKDNTVSIEEDTLVIKRNPVVDLSDNLTNEEIVPFINDRMKDAAATQCNSQNRNDDKDEVHRENKFSQAVRRSTRKNTKKAFTREKETKVEYESSCDDDDDILDGLCISNDTLDDSDTSNNVPPPQPEEPQYKPVKLKVKKHKKSPFNNVNERQAELLDNPDYQRIMNSGLSKREKDQETVFCRDCGKRLTFRYYVAVHAHIHTGNIPYKCEKCGKAFAKESLLRNHMRVHAESRDFSCEVCGKTFTTIYSLRIHRVNHTEERPHKCKVCSKTFKATAPLKKHELIHRNDRKYMCELCGRSFIEKVGLRKHILTHNTEKNFVCSTCGKRFGCKRSLCNHFKRHSSERPYVCNHCGKRFKCNRSLRNHITLHTGPNLFPCKVCGKNFRQRASLPKHMRIHTGETPYPCEYCPSKFKYSHHLQNHIRVHHKDKYLVVKRDGLHQGDSCDKESPSSVKLEVCYSEVDYL